MNSTEYESLPAELKKEMILNSERNKNLKLGFYSKSYTIENDGKIYKYRFHCISHYNNKNHHTIIFSGKTKPHQNKVLENDNILFYDSELNCSLKLSNDIFENEVVDMNLSPEQKLLLAEGQEITLNVSQKRSLNNNYSANVYTNSTRTKTFSPDYGYFLSANSLFLKENHELKKSQQKILNK